MNTRSRFAIAIAGVSLSLLAGAPAYATLPRASAPVTTGWSMEVWRQAKYPWLYGPRLAAPVATPAPRIEPWTAEGWRQVKFPWLYGPRTTVKLGLICPAQHFPPGDIRAVMAIKNPAAFAPRNCE